MKTTIVIADGDAGRRALLAGSMAEQGHAIAEAVDAGAVERLLTGRQATPGDILLLLHVELTEDMAGGGAAPALRWLQSHGEAIPVILLTTEERTAEGIEAVKAGASDFLVLPCATERLAISVRNALALARYNGNLRWLSRAAVGHQDFSDLVAESGPIREAVRLARRAARSALPVLIRGESGTGKETFARAIHGASDRAGQPFVAVNCGAVPANAIGPVLFGRRKSDAPGKLAEANGGTLFLDDVDDLPSEAQAELIRAIEAYGATKGEQALPGIRLLSASRQDLAAHVSEGTFREDLYYRLSVLPLELPPLRDRPEDIPVLARRMLGKYAARGDTTAEDFSTVALERLVRAAWPGNIRELETTVQHAALMADGRLIGIDDLPAPVAHPRNGEAKSLESGANGRQADGEAPSPGQPRILIGEDGHIRRLFDIEKDAIRVALRLYGGQVSETARRLGIGRSTLYRKMDDLQIDRNGVG